MVFVVIFVLKGVDSFYKVVAVCGFKDNNALFSQLPPLFQSEPSIITKLNHILMDDFRKSL